MKLECKFNRLILVGLLLVLGDLPAAAQTVFKKNVHPKGVYLKIHKLDKRQPPLRIKLSKIGIKSGDKITLKATGDYKSGDRFLDDSTGMIAVFVGTNRKKFISPGTGSSVSNAPTRTCWKGNFKSNDIVHDFVVGSGDVIVPKRAKSILVSAYDCHFLDNTDPDKDFYMQIIKNK